MNKYTIPVEDLQKSLKDAVTAASEKFNVSVSDLQKMYNEDQNSFKAFVAEAKLCKDKINSLYNNIIGAKNIFDDFDKNFNTVCKQSLFKVFDSIEVVRASDGSVMYSIGKNVKTIKSVNIEALKEVCGVTVGATIEKLPDLWSKAFVRAKYSKDKLLPLPSNEPLKGY